MDRNPTLITGCDVYATRGGRLVFIKEITQSESDPTGKAYGYSIDRASRQSVRKWRVWTLSGEILSDDGPEWDIVEAL
jgi:hypothetical protein